MKKYPDNCPECERCLASRSDFKNHMKSHGWLNADIVAYDEEASRIEQEQFRKEREQVTA